MEGRCKGCQAGLGLLAAGGAHLGGCRSDAALVSDFRYTLRAAGAGIRSRQQRSGSGLY